MEYQILKQYLPGNDNIWVGAISSEDDLELFETLEEAEIRLEELETLDPTRGFKIVQK
jgi:hypothetical protein